MGRNSGTDRNNQFNLYLKIGRKLSLELPCERDRIIAIKWLKTLDLCNHEGDAHLRNHYIELLLVSLLRKRLVGPFKEAPSHPSADRLERFVVTYQPADIGQLILKEEFGEYGTPPYHVEVSGDLQEYVAYQNIPDFGAHFYYAYSATEPIYDWNNLDKAILPVGYEQKNKNTAIKKTYSVVNVLPVNDDGTMENQALQKPVERLPEHNNPVLTPIAQYRGYALRGGAGSLEEVSERMKRVSKMPKRLMERLTRKIEWKKPKEQEPTTPLIFQRDTRPPYGIRYKPQEFGLNRTDRFVPALKFFKGLEWTPSGREIRRKVRDVRKFQATNDIHPVAIRDADVPEIPGVPAIPVVQIESDVTRSSRRRSPDVSEEPTRPRSPEREKVEKDLAESLKRRAQANRPAAPEIDERVRQHQDRIREIQRYKPRRIAYEDESEDEPVVEPRYDRIQYEEFPVDQADLTILDDEEMNVDDVFGEDNILDANVLRPNVAPNEEDGILDDEDMITDDIFGEAHIENANVLPVAPMPREENEIMRDDEMVFDDVFGFDEIQQDFQATAFDFRVGQPGGHAFIYKRHREARANQQPIDVERLNEHGGGVQHFFNSPNENSRNEQQLQNIDDKHQDEPDGAIALIDPDQLNGNFVHGYIAIPVPGTNFVGYATPETEDTCRTFLETATDMEKQWFINAGQSLMTRMMINKYRRYKGEPELTAAPYEAPGVQSYKDRMADLLEPTELRPMIEVPPTLLDVDDRNVQYLTKPLIGSPKRPPHQLEGYENYVKAMEPYAQEAKIRPIADLENFNQPYADYENELNRRIVDEPEFDESDEVPDVKIDDVEVANVRGHQPNLLLDQFQTPPKQVFRRIQPGILDESFEIDQPPLIAPPLKFPPRRDSELLLSDEMLTDDIFGEDRIAEPERVVYVPPIVEKERHQRSILPQQNLDREQLFRDYASGNVRRDVYEDRISDEDQPSLVGSILEVSIGENLVPNYEVRDVDESSLQLIISEGDDENVHEQLAPLRQRTEREWARAEYWQNIIAELAIRPLIPAIEIHPPSAKRPPAKRRVSQIPKATSAIPRRKPSKLPVFGGPSTSRTIATQRLPQKLEKSSSKQAHSLSQPSLQTTPVPQTSTARLASPISRGTPSPKSNITQASQLSPTPQTYPEIRGTPTVANIDQSTQQTEAIWDLRRKLEERKAPEDIPRYRISLQYEPDDVLDRSDFYWANELYDDFNVSNKATDRYEYDDSKANLNRRIYEVDEGNLLNTSMEPMEYHDENNTGAANILDLSSDIPGLELPTITPQRTRKHSRKNALDLEELENLENLEDEIPDFNQTPDSMQDQDENLDDMEEPEFNQTDENSELEHSMQQQRNMEGNNRLDDLVQEEENLENIQEPDFYEIDNTRENESESGDNEPDFRRAEDIQSDEENLADIEQPDFNQTGNVAADGRPEDSVNAALDVDAIQDELPEVFEPPQRVHEPSQRFKNFLANLAELSERIIRDRTGNTHEQNDKTALLRSVEISKQVHEFRRRHNERMGRGPIAPLPEEGTAFREYFNPDLMDPMAFIDYNDPRGILDESITEVDLQKPLLGAPEPVDYREQLNKSLERRVQNEIEQQKMHDHDEEEEEDKDIVDEFTEPDPKLLPGQQPDLIFDPLHTPPRVKRIYRPDEPDILDRSIEEGFPTEALVAAPEHFPPRRDSDLLEDDEMYIDDVFGNEMIATPPPMQRFVPASPPKPSPPIYVRDPAREKLYADYASGRHREEIIPYEQLDDIEEPDFYDYDNSVEIVTPSDEDVAVSDVSVAIGHIRGEQPDARQPLVEQPDADVRYRQQVEDDWRDKEWQTEYLETHTIPEIIVQEPTPQKRRPRPSRLPQRPTTIQNTAHPGPPGVPRPLQSRLPTRRGAATESRLSTPAVPTSQIAESSSGSPTIPDSPMTALVKRGAETTRAYEAIKENLARRLNASYEWRDEDITATSSRHREHIYDGPDAIQQYEQDMNWMHNRYSDDFSVAGIETDRIEYPGESNFLNAAVYEVPEENLLEMSDRDDDDDDQYVNRLNRTAIENVMDRSVQHFDGAEPLINAPLGILEPDEMVTNDLFGDDRIAEPMPPSRESRYMSPNKENLYRDYATGQIRRDLLEQHSNEELDNIAEPDYYDIESDDAIVPSVDAVAPSIEIPHAPDRIAPQKENLPMAPIPPMADRGFSSQDHKYAQALLNSFNQIGEHIQRQIAEQAGNLTDLTLAKSLAGTQRTRELQRRIRERSGLSPIADVQIDQPALMNYLNPPLLDPPEVHLYDEPKPGILDAPIENDDRLLTPLAQPPQNQPNYMDTMRALFSTPPDDSNRLNEYHVTDYINPVIFPGVSTSDELGYLVKRSIERSNAQPVYRRDVLDESIDEDNLQEPLIEQPTGFVRDQGLLHEDEMKFDDLFGDGQVMSPVRTRPTQQNTPVDNYDFYNTHRRLLEKLIFKEAAYRTQPQNNDMRIKINDIRQQIKEIETDVPALAIMRQRNKEYAHIGLNHFYSSPQRQRSTQSSPTQQTTPLRARSPRAINYIEMESPPQGFPSPTTRARTSQKTNSNLNEESTPQSSRTPKRPEELRTPIASRRPATNLNSESPPPGLSSTRLHARSPRQAANAIASPPQRMRSPKSVTQQSNLNSESPPPDLSSPRSQEHSPSQTQRTVTQQARRTSVTPGLDDRGSTTRRQLQKEKLHPTSDQKSPQSAQLMPVGATDDNMAPSPIGKTNVAPEEQGFLWLDALMPQIAGPSSPPLQPNQHVRGMYKCLKTTRKMDTAKASENASVAEPKRREKEFDQIKSKTRQGRDPRKTTKSRVSLRTGSVQASRHWPVEQSSAKPRMQEAHVDQQVEMQVRISDPTQVATGSAKAKIQRILEIRRIINKMRPQAKPSEE